MNTYSARQLGSEIAERAVLRQYQSEDFDWLVNLHARHYTEIEGFDDSFARLVASILNAFQTDHDPARECGWVAEADSTRLGSIFCVRLNTTTAKLRLFVLESEARGLGLGKRLLSECMGFARTQGYTRMQLWTHESHVAACALYAKARWTCRSSKPVHSFGVDLIEQAWDITL